MSTTQIPSNHPSSSSLETFVMAALDQEPPQEQTDEAPFALGNIAMEELKWINQFWPQLKTTCGYGGGGQRSILSVVPRAPSFLVFVIGSLTHGVHQFSEAVWSESPRDPPVSVSPALGLWEHTTTHSHVCEHWYSDSGPHACRMSNWLVELSPQLSSLGIL